MKQNRKSSKSQDVKCEQKPKDSHNPFLDLRKTAQAVAKIDGLIASGRSLYSIFMEACRANDYSVVDIILSRSELREQEIINGFILSCTFNCLNTASHIFKQGINVHYNSDEALRIAVRRGALSIVKFLIANGADLKANWSESLGIARAKNNKEMIDLLAIYDVNQTQKPITYVYKDYSKIENIIVPTDPKIKLQELCSKKQYNEIKVILKKHPDILKENSYLISIAIRDKDLKLFKIMVPYGADVKDMQNFLMACETGHIPTLKYFIKNGAKKVNITLMYACKSGAIKSVSLLFKDFIFSPNEISSAFADAIKYCKRNKVKMLKFLLDKGADINYFNGDPLKNAIESGNYKTVNFLIKAGAKPSYEVGLVPAAINNNMKAIKYIFRKSNTEDFKHQAIYALSHAISMGYYDIAKYLIRKGIDVRPSYEDIVNNAIASNTIEHLDFLFKNVVNIKDVSVQIFADAVRERAFKVIQYLLDKGFLVNAKNASPLINLFKSSYLKLRETECQFGSEGIDLSNIGKKSASNAAEIYFENTKMEFVKAIQSKNINLLNKLLMKFEVADVLLLKLLFVASNPKKYSIKIIIKLLNLITNPNSIDNQTIQNLFMINSKYILSVLIRSGLNLSEKFESIVVGVLIADNINLFKRFPWERFNFLYSKFFEFAVFGKAAKILAYMTKRNFKIKNYNYASLHMAIKRGNLNILKFLLAHGATFHPFEKNYLMLAYNQKRAKILIYLIEEAGLSLNEIPDYVYEYYLLWRSFKALPSREGSEKLISLNNFYTYLNHEAILVEDVQKIKNRYEASVIPFLFSLSDDIFYAISVNRMLSAEYLLSISNTEMINYAMLRFLLIKKFYEAKILLMRGANVAFENNKPILLACLDNDIPFIEFLIQNGLRLHPDGDYALSSSIRNECYEAAKYLLSRGADIHYDEDTIIRGACMGQDEKMLNFLVNTNLFDKERVTRNIQYSITNNKLFSAQILIQLLGKFY